MPDLDDMAIQAESAIERIGRELDLEDYIEYLKNVRFYVDGLIRTAQEDAGS